MSGWCHAILDLPRTAPGRGRAEAFWSAALGWPLGDPWPALPEFASFTPPSGDSYVHRQLVEEGEPGVHLDVEVADLDAEAARLTALGAVEVRRTPDWYTLTSPGGAAFCLLHEQTPVRPDPVAAAGGRRRRLVQVCLDLPAVHREAEVAFWRDALRWRFVEPGGEEFPGRLVPPPGSSLQVLLQELGPDDRGTRTRAHLDLGSDDVPAEAEALVGLGAELIGTGDGWVALHDPLGSPFCVTGNSPDRP